MDQGGCSRNVRHKLSWFFTHIFYRLQSRPVFFGDIRFYAGFWRQWCTTTSSRIHSMVSTMKAYRISETWAANTTRFGFKIASKHLLWCVPPFFLMCHGMINLLLFEGSLFFSKMVFIKWWNSEMRFLSALLTLLLYPFDVVFLGELW